ncbi:MAG TPA: hypothetical protein VFN10_14385 [Thermoanaerobaculia bacterium]|nr:hypothetical protein [Thermoanaerobaculia bacterium]
MTNLVSIKQLSREALRDFVDENLRLLTEDEVHAILENPYVTPALIGSIAQQTRLTANYNVRVRIVAHRQTPQAHAVKLVHYLYFFDLLRLSTEVTVPAPVRRAIDIQLVNRVDQLTLGERIASARRCGTALIKSFLFDPDPKVFESLLANKRLREDDLLLLASSTRATVDQLLLIAGDRKWSYRYAIRLALVMNAKTPRSVAASQLRYLRRNDLRSLHARPETSVYLRRCIERLRPDDFSVPAELSGYNAGTDA